MTTEQDVLDLAAKVVAGNDNLDRLHSAINDAPGVWSTADGISVTNLRRRLAQVGYQVPVAFESGLVAEDGSFTVIYNGDTYAANPASTPFTTTGTFNASQWVISFTASTASDYGLGDDSGPLIDNVDTWYRGGAAFGYGGSHVSATPGDNPFPDLNGLFHMTTVNSSLGVDDDYVHQTAYYYLIATGVVYEARRTRTTGVWSAWTDTHGADTADNNFHFLTRAAAATWCDANTPSVGTEISIYVPGTEQSVVRFAYTGAGSHFSETEFDGWVPTGDVELEHFGAVGNGTTNDAAAILAAATYVNGLGGGKVYGRSRKYRIATNLTIPRSVTLQGPHSFTGAPGDVVSGTVDFDLDTMTGALVIDSTATITVEGNAGVIGWYVHRYGMSLPEGDSLGFAGTAFTVAKGDDVSICENLIIGFARAIDHVDGSRPNYISNAIDCLNGIRMEGNQDVGFVNQNHCWPFATIGQRGCKLVIYANEAGGPFVVGETVTGGASGAIGVVKQVVDDGVTGELVVVVSSGTFIDTEQITGGTSAATAEINGTPSNYDDLLRSGRAYEIIQADWVRMTDNFAYGYQQGFRITANSVSLLGCGADQLDSRPLSGSVGFYIAAARGRMANCQAAAQDNSAVRVNNTGSKVFSIVGMVVWGNSITNGVFIESGRVSVADSQFYDGINAIHVGATGASFIDGGGNHFDMTYDVTVNAVTDTSYVQLAPAMSTQAIGTPRVNVSSGSFSLRGVATTATMALPTEGNTFQLSGTATVSQITGGYAGRIVYFVATSAPTFEHTAAGSATTNDIVIGTGSDFTFAAGDSVMLIHNGSYWSMLQ